MSALTIFFILFAIAYANGLFLVRYLRRFYHDFYVELGEPSLTKSNLESSNLKLLKLIWSLRFLKFSDAKLNTICFAAIFLEIGITVAAVWWWIVGNLTIVLRSCNG